MSSPSYISFLACFHPGRTDLYFNGLPIGAIREGIFAAHQHVIGDQPRALRFEDLSHPCPFKTVAELKASLIAAIEAIDLPETVNKATT